MIHQTKEFKTFVKYSVSSMILKYIFLKYMAIDILRESRIFKKIHKGNRGARLIWRRIKWIGIHKEISLRSV